MTFALTAALILSIALAGLLVDRKDARSKLERDADRDERQLLLQRIQAPEAAVIDYSQQGLPPDSSGFPESDEQIAEREERERVIQFIERHEG